MLILVISAFSPAPPRASNRDLPVRAVLIRLPESLRTPTVNQLPSGLLEVGREHRVFFVDDGVEFFTIVPIIFPAVRYLAKMPV